MSGHYILEGKKAVPCDLMTWAQWLDTADEKRVVAKTEVGDGRVSTVFLGLDHSYGEGPPQIFETLVFEGPMHGEMDRYATWAEAEEGHARMVARVESVYERATGSETQEGGASD